MDPMVGTGDQIATDDEVIEVLIVDDQSAFRAAARTVIGVSPGFAVAAEAESGEEGVVAAGQLSGALVLMDINLPGINGIEATRRIVAADPGVTVVLMSTYTADDLPADARSCGAADYVHKEDLFPDVLRRIWDETHPGSTRS